MKPLAMLLFCNDEAVITAVCPALSLILPGIPEVKTNMNE